MTRLHALISRSSRKVSLAVALLIGSIILGGGGYPAPLAEIGLELCIGLLFLGWLNVSRTPVSGCVWFCACMIMLLPALQLLPLPPVVWHALPGREVERQALSLIGAGESWRPFTMTPDRTLSVLLSALAAGMALVILASLNHAQRLLPVLAVISGALLSIALGVFQMAGGEGGWAQIYGDTNAWLTGFQANHNSQADIILIAIVMSGLAIRQLMEEGLVRSSGGAVLVMDLSLAVFLGFCVVLTGSRTGIALIPLAFLFNLILLAPLIRPLLQRRWRLHLLVLGLLLVALIMAFISNNDVIARMIERFHLGRDLRWDFWADSRDLAVRLGPWGAGMGSFVPLFMGSEQLSIISSTIVNRAHCDYLEFYIESGVPGLAVALVMSALVMKSGGALLCGKDVVPRVQAIGALGVVTIVALHSMVDYPLRSMSLVILTIFALSMLLPASLAAKSTEVRNMAE